MFPRPMHFVLSLPAFVATPASQAHAQTTITAHRIDIGGNKDIDATAINDHDAITATVFDQQHATQAGVVLHDGVVTTLPAPYRGSGAAIPRAINDRGDVLGYTYEGYQPVMFLWQDGQYNQAASQIPLEIEQEPGPPPLPIGLNSHDAVFYTIITGMQNPTDPIHGQLSNLHGMPVFLRYQTARSINQAGMIAGNSFYEAQSEVFVGKGRKSFTILMPPGAASSNGGFVNDKEQVAGTYTDKSNVQHGFVWQGGSYASFDLPEQAQPYSMTVSGINNNGRVVGTYTSASANEIRAFLFNGSTVTVFGNYNPADTVAAAINNGGTMLVSDERQDDPADYASYRVICSGSGC